MKSFRRKSALAFILIVLGSYAFSQINLPISLIYLPQGIVLDGLSGFGYNESTSTTISNFNNTNPACIYDFDKFMIGLSYQYETKIDEAWIAEIGHSRAYPNFPQSFGFVYSLNSLKLGFGTSQIYNSEKDYGKIERTIISDNNQDYIDVDVVYPEKKEIVLRNSFSMAYNLKNLVEIPGNIVVGMRYNFNYLNYKFDMTVAEESGIDAEIFSSNLSLGIRYDFPESEMPSLKLGMYYDTKTEYKKTKSYFGEPYRFIGYMPGKLHYGFQLDITKAFYLSGDVAYMFWEKIDRDSNNKLNDIDLSGTFGCYLSKKMNLSLGIYSSVKNYKYVDGIFSLNNMNAQYLICGLLYSGRHLFFELVLADSHLLSDEWRKQTVGKFGIGYEF